MNDYFDKTFFKFAIGFLAVLAVSFLILFAVNAIAGKGANIATTILSIF